WRNRVGNLLWPYLLWSVVFAFVAAYRYRPSDPRSYTLKSIENIPFGGDAYWFLSVLLLVFIVARIGRNFIPVLFVFSIALLGFAPLMQAILTDEFGFHNT